ncbi:hypothetical protein, partial [Acinetobacter baumannii]|uniref:hypothetical protein n=1 Tax=Acinetobacter baumannii TaxID=470 RepID=UPI0011779A61
REVVGSTAYINERLTTADKPVKMIFWTGDALPVPGYDRLDFTREVVGSTAYINERLTTADKPVKMIFWTGDALP